MQINSHVRYSIISIMYIWHKCCYFQLYYFCNTLQLHWWHPTWHKCHCDIPELLLLTRQHTGFWCWKQICSAENFYICRKTDVKRANRALLLLRTPGPDHLGFAFALMLRPFISELVMSMDLLSFEYPSVLLFCLLQSAFSLSNITKWCIFALLYRCQSPPPWGRRGFESRIRPPYPPRVVKCD